MILKKLKSVRPIIVLLFFSFLVLSPFVIKGLFTEINFAQAKNTCGFEATATGNFSINSSCSIMSGVDGIDQGNLTVGAGKTITIDSGAQLVMNPKKEIYFGRDITSQLIIVKPSNPGGAVVKGTLCAVDADGDGYAKYTTGVGQTNPSFTIAAGEASCGNGLTRKSLLLSQTQLDCLDSDPTKFKQDCVLSDPNYAGDWTNDGICGQYGTNLLRQSRNWTKTVLNLASECGGVACGPQSGTEVQNIACTPPACTSGVCCDIPNGSFKPASASCSSTNCNSLDYYYISGAASPSGTNYTYRRNYNAVTVYCDGAGNCSNYTCNSYGDTLIGTCDICKYASGDAAGCTNYNSSTACSTTSCSSNNNYWISGTASPTGTNYTYLRSYSSVTTYCNSSGSCNNYTCNVFGDTLIGTCGLCQQASGTAAGCTNYPAATACGTTTCAADFYNLSGSTCYFNDYPASVGNTCNSSGSCVAGACSSTQSAQATAGACQSITGCTGSTPGTVIGTQYWNTAQSASNFTRNNCGACQTGTKPTYTVAANTFSSCTSQADANAQALAAAVAANTQAWANTNGTCTGGQFFNSVAGSSSAFQKNNCALCTTGTTPIFTVPINTISSCISIADANTQAQAAAVAGDTQDWANTNGGCTNQVDTTVCGTTSCSSNNYAYVSGAASPTGTNYTYLRSYDNVTTYCNGSGSCNKYTCGPYGDSLIATCGTCVQAYASGITGGCTSYISGTVCGTASCPASFYNLSSGICYYNTYPATVNNTCNGSGTCTNNVGTCSYSTSESMRPNNECETITGCTGSTGPTRSGAKYWNVAQSRSAYTRSDCAACQVGSTPMATIAANTYSSCISQADANSKAWDAVVALNTQAWANSNGICTGTQYWNNTAGSYGIYSRNNCALCTTGTTPIFTVPINTISSCISIADANTKAQAAAVAGDTQDWANTNGGCTNQVDTTVCGTTSCSSNNYAYVSGAASPTGTNYTYLRSYDNVTTYCNGSGSCNKYTCGPYGDSLIATCGTCVQAYASGITGGCTNYASGTICGTPACPADYYSYANPNCSFCDYPATVNNTCNGSGTCTNNVGTCSPNCTVYATLANGCQTMSGCTGSTPGTPTGTQYSSAYQERSNLQKSNCGTCQTGTYPKFIVNAGTYTSCTSQAAADALATNYINTNYTQTWANTNGGCTGGQYFNTVAGSYNIFQKTNCGTCKTGNYPAYTTAVGSCSSCVSVADANAICQAQAVAGDTQAWANSTVLGTCSNDSGNWCGITSCSSKDYAWVSGTASPTGTNYTYLRDHNDVDVYCSAGSCSSYTCTVNVGYVDVPLATCGTCVYAYASGITGGCTNYVSGTGCGTAACPADYYSYANPNCYFNNYPDTVSNTCNGSGTCTNNVASCSSSATVQSTLGLCQTMSGCTGSTPGTPTGGPYWNDACSSNLYQRLTCPACQVGNWPVYSIPANTYYSCISKADANKKCQDDLIVLNTQTWANNNGTCTGTQYWNVACSAANYQKTNCGTCKSGNWPVYSIAANTYSSCTSQAAANTLCQNAANAGNTQDWANNTPLGTCSNLTGNYCASANCSYLNKYWNNGTTIYYENHPNANVYCNAGTCNNYDCTPHSDDPVDTCTGCRYIAASNSSSCSNYGSGTVCGTAACPADYYSYANPNCSFCDYPATVNNTCNGSGTCTNNAGTCSPNCTVYATLTNGCQSMSGCTGSTAGTIVGTQYWNDACSAANYQKTNCPTCQVGNWPVYTIAANTYSSCTSKAAANTLCQNAANAGNTQVWANSTGLGTCTGTQYWSNAVSASNYQKTNCGLCKTGNWPAYTIGANSCYSCVSVADATSICQGVANAANTQAWANSTVLGTCSNDSGNWCGITSCSSKDYAWVSGTASPTGTNYTYLRDHNDVDVYCSAGSCSSYTCTVNVGYVDVPLATCGTCVYAYASGITGGCTNYASGTVCGTPACPSDYYNFANPNCYFNDYPATVNNTCNGSGTCTNNVASCSSSQSIQSTLTNSCQTMSGCTGSTSGTPTGTQYWNDACSAANYQKTNCGLCKTGNYPAYSIAAGTYSSCTSKAAANTLCQNAANAANTQAWADSTGLGTCSNDTGNYCSTTGCSGNNKYWNDGSNIYYESHPNANVYCNAGACTSYDCSPHTDTYIDTCVLCRYIAASTSSSCSNRASGYGCGTAACPSDYYNFANPNCYFNDYPATVNNTCNGSGTCTNNAGTCSYGTSTAMSPNNECEWISGCTGATGPTRNGTKYYSAAQSRNNLQKNDCGACQTGSYPTFSVAYAAYTSCTSQAAADQKATDYINLNYNQAWANANGTCSGTEYWNEKSGTSARYTRNNCLTCTYGTTPTYSTGVKVCSSCVSVADADAICQALAVTNNTQAWANIYGSCLNSPPATVCGSASCSSIDYAYVYGAPSPTGTNYAYLRNHSNVTKYCNGSGSCSNYTCTVNVGYVDNLIATCGICVQAYASGTTGGCTDYATGTACGACVLGTNAAGACQRTGNYDTCDKGSCSGRTSTCTENAPTAGNVWNGSAWQAADCTYKCYSSAATCSLQLVKNSIYGCNTSGTCDTSNFVTRCTLATCSGNEASWCSTGSCQYLCGDGADNDSDGYTDMADSDCTAWQCTSGDCCNTTTHQYRLSTYNLGNCRKCTGTNENSVVQTASEDLWGVCDTGAAGSITACKSNFCNNAGSCGYLGTSAVCNTTYSNPANGSCSYTKMDQKCQGYSYPCLGATTNTTLYVASGKVWWNGSQQNVNSSMYCGVSSPYKCDGTSPGWPQGYPMGCNNAGSCSWQSPSYAVNYGSRCTDNCCNPGVCDGPYQQCGVTGLCCFPKEYCCLDPGGDYYCSMAACGDKPPGGEDPIGGEVLPPVDLP